MGTDGPSNDLSNQDRFPGALYTYRSLTGSRTDSPASRLTCWPSKEDILPPRNFGQNQLLFRRELYRRRFYWFLHDSHL